MPSAYVPFFLSFFRLYLQILCAFFPVYFFSLCLWIGSAPSGRLFGYLDTCGTSAEEWTAWKGSQLQCQFWSWEHPAKPLLASAEGHASPFQNLRALAQRRSLNCTPLPWNLPVWFILSPSPLLHSLLLLCMCHCHKLSVKEIFQSCSTYF